MLLLVLISGILLQILAFSGSFYGFYIIFALVLFFLPLFYLINKLIFYLKLLYFDEKNKKGYILLCFLLVILASHFVQVLVPETGFDAVWYHLPVARAIVENSKIVYLPEYYQSLNPLFADLYFTAGYSLALEFSNFGLSIGNFSFVDHVYFGAEIGAKLVAYVFMLYFLWGVWRLARLHLAKKPSLLLLCMVATFQVVSWQAASFYIDIAKAFFEIVALYYLSLFLLSKNEKIVDISNSTNTNLSKNLSAVNKFLKLKKLLQVSKISNCNLHKNKNLIFSSLFLGASLASKVFSILLLPVFLMIVIIQFFQNLPTFKIQEKFLQLKNMFSPIFLFVFFTLILPMPFYLFSYYHTCQFVPSVGIHLDKLSQIGGEQSTIAYLFQRTISLPFSIFQVLFLRDYVSAFVGLFLILAIKNWRSELSIFAISSWLIFWFVPPLSTRYAISGFVVLLIVGFKEIFEKESFKEVDFYELKKRNKSQNIKLNKNIFKVFSTHISQKKIIFYLFLFSVIVAFLPRIYVNYRSLRYLFSNQTQQQYLEQFYDGNIDDKLKMWYDHF